MVENNIQRKLKVIFSADVKGYSKLMGDDDEHTVSTITTYREIISALIEKGHGRVIDAPGDNILAEFDSSLDAVQSAIAIQNVLKVENEKLPDNRRMEFRIGINLGDIIHKDDRIYGDGVNIAARIEGLADPGGICISRGVYEQVDGKLEIGFVDRGQHSVKNIKKPVNIFKVLLNPKDTSKFVGVSKKKALTRRSLMMALTALIVIIGGTSVWYYHLRTDFEPASVNNMAYPLSDKPSIAVLSFYNTTDDSELDYFTNGFTDTLVTALSKMPGIILIARSSTSVYKGESVKIKKVAEELGVHYVIDGSIHKSGDRIRVTVRMIDVLAGYHAWSDQYKRSIKDIFTIQDDIVLNIIKSIGGKFDRVIGSAPLEVAGTNNLDAYLKNLKALYLYETNFSRENFVSIIRLAEEALIFDPNYLNPHITIVYAKARAARYGFTENPDKLRYQALDLARKAVELRNDSARAHGAQARAYYELKQYDESIAEYKKVLELDPNEPTGYDIGWALCYSGRAGEAFPYFEKSRRLNPKSIIPLLGLSLVNLITGYYEKAIPFLLDGIEINPNFLRLHLDLAACFAALGKVDEAIEAASQVQKLNPAFSVDDYINKGLPVTNLVALQNYVNALKKIPFPTP